MCFEVERRMRWSVAVGIAVVASFAGSSLADLSNGAFEAGNLSGWTLVLPTSGNPFAGAVTGYPSVTPSWTASEGSYFALLKTDGSGSFTQLYRSFDASAGDTLSLDFFWDADGDPTKRNDLADGRILSGADLSGALVTTLFTRSVQDYPDSPSWESVSYLFTTPGTHTYTLLFEIENMGSAANDSHIGIDNVHLVPIPAAVLLGMLGLAAAGLKLRKFV